MKLILKVIGIIVCVTIIADYYTTFDFSRIPKNSYYSDVTYELPEFYRNHFINQFITHLYEKKYQEAYYMLSDSCKVGMFQNSIENFSKYMEENYIKDWSQMDKDKLLIYFISILSEEENNVKMNYTIGYEVMENGILKKVLIPLNLEEMGPFQHRIDLNVEGEE